MGACACSLLEMSGSTPVIERQAFLGSSTSEFGEYFGQSHLRWLAGGSLELSGLLQNVKSTPILAMTC